ncbi:hypothetical protein GYMLUDRAFT_249022 [Collybiopsis luxurians FD-317 M1]|uniref:Uncharacterized protein n=1 Tax=Collybiopsis luxurians FD-317 M1 TaxID=944289 RepID=A0A0D0CJ66_9AGAR|nr:hypothetical protein GYMLUDRAFT_249022 [Collybiopsis luxurians FD-317 M1]
MSHYVAVPERNLQPKLKDKAKALVPSQRISPIFPLSSRRRTTVRPSCAASAPTAKKVTLAWEVNQAIYTRVAWRSIFFKDKPSTWKIWRIRLIFVCEAIAVLLTINEKTPTPAQLIGWGKAYAVKRDAKMLHVAVGFAPWPKLC